MTDQIDKLAVEVSDNFHKDSNANLVALSTGVTLRVKSVSNILFMEFQKKHPQPKIPMWHNEENGRDEPNPNNPDYLEAMQLWQSSTGLGMIDLMIIMGTSLESVAGEAPKFECDDWIDDLAFAGIMVDGSNRRARWLAYVKYIAAPEDADMQKLMNGVSGQSGVAEADVQTAAIQFRDKE